MPTTAVCMPSGNGGLSGVPSTKCVSEVGMGSGRPGSASSGATMRVFEPRRNILIGYDDVPARDRRCDRPDRGPGQGPRRGQVRLRVRGTRRRIRRARDVTIARGKVVSVEGATLWHGNAPRLHSEGELALLQSDEVVYR